MVTERVRRWAVTAISIVALFVIALLASPPVHTQNLVNLRHWSGQTIGPVYDGFDINDDGSYNMWFGYMNRNMEEEIDLPVGPDNMFEPGAPDRGQPTHFAPDRHKDVFKVVVPKDFGVQNKLTWKISVRGQAQTIAATLNPVWQIDRKFSTRGGSDDKIDSNTPPVVHVEPPTQTIAVGGRAVLNVQATDDGLPKRRRPFAAHAMSEEPPVFLPGRGAPAGGGRGGPDNPGLSFEWNQYRGPGKVTFSPKEGMMVAGKVVSNATFSEPGEYILQIVVDDGSGESAGDFGYHCCWTNAEMKVIVKGSDTTGQQR